LTELLLKLGGLSRVTGVPIPRLGRWLDRNTIQSSHLDTTTSGSGDYRQFGRNTVNKVAIARKLIGLGISAGPANADAAQFTDFGDDDRAANELYEFGLTVLIKTEHGTTIKNLESDASLIDACGRPFTAVVAIDLGQIVREVDDALNTETKRNTE
jgi:hypothetical protein